MKAAYRIAFALLVSALVLTPGGLSAGNRPKPGPDPKTWNAVVDNAVKYLKSTQQDSGGWSTDKGTRLHPGLMLLLLW